MNLHELTAHEILSLIQSKKTTAQDVYQSVAQHIDAHEENIHAYARLNKNPKITDGSTPIPIGIRTNATPPGGW